MRTIVFLVLAVAVGVAGAPVFLVHSCSSARFDCALVMCGGERNNLGRFQGGRQLLDQGRAGSVLIPALLRMEFPENITEKMARAGSSKVRLLSQRVSVPVVHGHRLRLFGRSFRIFEHTHLELLTGRRMMEKLGYRSAVIVSSPYQMRRLQLIANKVFGDDFLIGFAPTPFEEYDVIGCYS